MKIRNVLLATALGASYADVRVVRRLEESINIKSSRVEGVAGGEPDAGRYLRAWVTEAGFVDELTTASSWCYAEPSATQAWGTQWASRVSEGSFADAAVSTGAATRAELDEIAGAWRQWAAHPTAFFAFIHGEVLARKP